jgi:alkanesulfonate monooxygenase SsuD/methylene tetrahydromethanopterin reductase-like flavin-dependent oxidoreductase (luciferase family)
MSPTYIQWAEELGYDAAYLFDTPFQGDDVWVQLHRAAEKTSRITIGPGVLIPSMRHPLVNAANTISLHQLAPGRVAVGFGTGFSSQAAIGQPAVKWSYMERYISAYLALLRGQSTEWEGKHIQLLLPAELQGELPLRVPLLIAALGPRGNQGAARLGADGIIGFDQPNEHLADYPRSILVVMGTVLDPGESADDARVKKATLPLWALMYHMTYTMKSREAVLGLPGGREWLDVIEQHPEDKQHLAIHTGHVLEGNEADEAAWKVAAAQTLTQATWSLSAADMGARVRALADQGVTEVQIQSTGPDMRRELEAFASAVRGK